MEAAYQSFSFRSPAIARQRAGPSVGRLRDLAARLRLTISHFDVFRAIGIALERFVAAEVEFLCCRLTMRPLARTERRRSMIEQTRDIKDFLLRIAHDSYPIQQNAALHNSYSALQRKFQAKCDDFITRKSSHNQSVTNPIRFFKRIMTGK